MEDKLLFIIGPQRGGTTLLNRMLGAHSQVHAPVESHLLTPLAHLGYYRRVDEAPYDPIISQRGIRELVGALPGGEADYLAALRAYADRLYEGLLAPTGCSMLLDKTPAYALVLDFLARLYPNAHYVVLTRHPIAVWVSCVDSFFDGDHVAAHKQIPLLEHYVPPIASFLRESPVPIHHVRYEEMVSAPEETVQEICRFAGLPFEPGMIDYGDHAGDQAGGVATTARGLADPVSVNQQKRPGTGSLASWQGQLAGRPERVEQCLRILAALDDRDIATWGYARKDLEEELAGVDLASAPAPKPALNRYRLERKLLVLARRHVGDNALGRLVRTIREACDLLLR